MQYGLLLGILGILGVYTMGLSVSVTELSSVSLLLVIGSPVAAALMTLRFRRAVMLGETGFSFGRGFLFTFMMGLYAAVWVALFLFIYMAYFDNGAFAASYEAMLSRPDVQAEMQSSGALAGISTKDIVRMIREISPAQYAGTVFYLSILINPVCSAVIALITRRPYRGFEKTAASSPNCGVMDDERRSN